MIESPGSLRLQAAWRKQKAEMASEMQANPPP